MLHIGKSFYFSFVSDSLSIKNIGALCDSMGMYMNKTDNVSWDFCLFQGSFK